MAGHSKWANIKHRKERQDAKKGKIFTKWIRELTVAARQGGGDPGSNPRLRLALDKALGANMSRDIIDRAVARGAGAADTDDMVELTYEGYGPGGVAVMVECMTDNRNRGSRTPCVQQMRWQPRHGWLGSLPVRAQGADHLRTRHR